MTHNLSQEQIDRLRGVRSQYTPSRFDRLENFTERHPVLSIVALIGGLIVVNIILWGLIIAGVYFGLNLIGVI